MARSIRSTLALLAAAAISLSAPQPAWAESTNQPAITSVRADAALVSIAIAGVNLGTKPPRVTIGNVANALTITSATPTLVTALLPPGMVPGGYLLTYSAAKNKSGSDDNEGSNYDEFWVTLGAAGPQGPQGPKGDTGSPGPFGLTGPAGAKGDAGPQGPAGKDGATGPAGVQGIAGIAGSPGVQGPVGPQGAQGLQGTPGARGDGIELVGPATKDACAEGGQVFRIIGDKGPIAGSETTVCDGLQGLVGAAGPQGPAGPSGSQGPMGATGLAGPAGAKGDPGAQGPAGPAGPAGMAGAAGIAGPQGLPGANGANGLAGATGPAGATGAAGPAGSPGLPGPAGNSIALVGAAPKDDCESGGYVFQIVNDKGPINGTRTTICNGLRGLAGAAGAAGPSGPQGAAGAAGATGPTGPQGPAGSSGSSHLWARVDANGAILAGVGVTGVDALGQGTYFVHFNRDVTACAVLATGVAELSATVGHDPVDLNRVWVRLFKGYDLFGVPDYSRQGKFNLAALCP